MVRHEVACESFCQGEEVVVAGYCFQISQMHCSRRLEQSVALRRLLGCHLVFGVLLQGLGYCSEHMVCCMEICAVELDLAGLVVDEYHGSVVEMPVVERATAWAGLSVGLGKRVVLLWVVLG